MDAAYNLDKIIATANKNLSAENVDKKIEEIFQKIKVFSRERKYFLLMLAIEEYRLMTNDSQPIVDELLHQVTQKKITSEEIEEIQLAAEKMLLDEDVKTFLSITISKLESDMEKNSQKIANLEGKLMVPNPVMLVTKARFSYAAKRQEEAKRLLLIALSQNQFLAVAWENAATIFSNSGFDELRKRKCLSLAEKIRRLSLTKPPQTVG